MSYPDLLLTKPKGRSGQSDLYTWSPVRNVTGDEIAHVRNKSSILDVFNNELIEAWRFLYRTWLYAYVKYEPTNLLLFTPGNLPSKAKKMLMPWGHPWGGGAGHSWNLLMYKDLYGKLCKRDWVAKVVFLLQMLLTFGRCGNRYFWDIRLKIPAQV